ncbi:hypothetical protein [Paenibacillus beijingensis]|uniref:Uncharacterized protein n=1 Tax=Paenibacillus beijingensis TaxID=1126833 RepID=A0A0D5NQI3_9BACL|nr:hypothetical protein [Paenibacillus beijingensis]AJY77440.1 hypothetical protein VN24_02340 [Paenibacillus beijingensis]
MDTFVLLSLEIGHADWRRSLHFATAELVLLTEMGSRLWYIDVNGISEKDLLSYFSSSEDIKVELTATTAGGRVVSGTGFFHPNTVLPAAAIRGDGELKGIS